MFACTKSFNGSSHSHPKLKNIALLALLFGLGALTSPQTSSFAQTISELSPASADFVTAQRRIQVFFPKFPEAGNDFIRVVPVDRTAPSSSVARYSIEQLIAGPTATEQRRGLAPAVRLRGASNCGSDFTITLRNGTARLQFCRPVMSAGVGEDARAISAINATLKQFPTVNRVVVLTDRGNCLGDQSGMNRCLGDR
jgi:hypothetical protein